MLLSIPAALLPLTPQPLLLLLLLVENLPALVVPAAWSCVEFPQDQVQDLHDTADMNCVSAALRKHKKKNF